jgi:hypothetical protein
MPRNGRVGVGVSDWTVEEVTHATTILEKLTEKPGVYGAVLEMLWRHPVAARWSKVTNGLWKRDSVPEGMPVAQIVYVKKGVWKCVLRETEGRDQVAVDVGMEKSHTKAMARVDDLLRGKGYILP